MMLQKQIDSTHNTITPHKLCIEIGEKHLACLARTEDNIATSFQLYTYEKKALVEALQIIKNTHYAAITTWKEVRIIWQHEHALCIPATYFSQASPSYWANYLSIYSPQENILHTKEEDKTILFLVNNTLQKNIEVIFPKAMHQHKYTSILRHLATTEIPDNALLYTQFYDRVMIIAAYKEKKLQLLQTFSFENEKDVLYHLIHTIQQIGSELSTTIIHLSGNIDTASTLYKTLYSYLPTIVLDTATEASPLFTKEENIALHYFTPYFHNCY